MGTEKRERQKQQHQSRREAAAREAARRARLRRAATLLGAVLVVGGGAFALSLFGDDEGSADDASPDTTAAETTTTSSPFPPLVGPPPGETLTGTTPCPETDGSSPRTTTFAEAPPTCIDPTATYTATFSTSAGDFTAELDAADAPETVNNFVVLARYHFFDGIPFHRVVPDFVIQAGDPSESPSGMGGPGYQIAEEPPEDGTYEKYDLAMAKAQAPGSTGSQFFVVTGDPSPLTDGGYSLFGRVTAGQEVVDLIGAIETYGPQSDTPSQQIDIRSVTIAES